MAYVFVHLLPELGEHQEALAEAAGTPLGLLDRHVYLVALTGLAVFYALEQSAHASRREAHSSSEQDATSKDVFWIHTASYGVYNALIGYLVLHRLEQGVESMVIFAAAMFLHFIVNDYGLREHHKGKYMAVGRWLLAGAIIVGWGVGLSVSVPPSAIAVILAFLAGGVMLNVLKEELPGERASHLWAFVLGAAVYSSILLAI